MDIRPCFFLKAEKSIKVEEFQKLKSLGWPVMVSAQGAQKNWDWDQIVEESGQEGLHMVSSDVDDNKHILQLAWEACIEKSWTHLVVLEDLNPAILEKLPELMETCHKNPWALIVLSDQLSESKKSNFIERALMGGVNYNHLKSPNCCYPVFFIQNISLKRTASLGHLKLLVSLLWRKVEVLSIALNQSQKEEVKGKGFSSWLYQMHYDTLLVSIANIKQNDRPKNAALSCAVGAFIACTPFYGMQSFLIFIACFVFRLNFPIAFIGSQVSLPPIYSLILPLEIYVGFKLMNKPFIQEGDILQTAQNHFSSWLLGSAVVGGVIAIVVGFVWFYLQKAMKKEKKVNWSGKMRGGKLGNTLIVMILKSFGQKTGYFLLYFIVPYFYLFAPKARRGLNEYWKIRAPNSSWWTRQRKVLKQIMIFARILVDRGLQAHSKEFLFDVDLSESIDFRKEANDEKPLVISLSHVGGWAITMQGFSKKAQSKPITIIEYENKHLATDKAMQNKGYEIVDRLIIRPGEPLFMKLHELLSHGGNLGVMGDRPFDENIELLPFMGKLAPIPMTAYRLAKMYKSQLVVLIGVKTGYRSYKMISKTIEAKTPQEMVKEYLEFLEENLNRYPYQWFNFYKFWSNLPTLPNGQLCLPRKYKLESSR